MAMINQLDQELQIVQAKYPAVWQYIQELQQPRTAADELLHFDDNDDVIAKEDYDDSQSIN